MFPDNHTRYALEILQTPATKVYCRIAMLDDY